MPTPSPDYAELHCLSNFSFLRGASHPHELVETAHALGYRALALTDECSLAGIVRAHRRARELVLQLIVGSELQLEEGVKLLLLVQNAQGYSQLCQLISRARRAAAKGEYQLDRALLEEHPLDDCLAIWLPPPDAQPVAVEWLLALFPARLWLGVELHRGPEDARQLRQWQRLGQQLGLPLVACGDVHMHAPQRRLLQDTLTAIRHGCTLSNAGQRLFPNAERHLRSRAHLAAIYPAEVLAESVVIAGRCQFSLDELNYRYPAENLPPGLDANAYLRQLAEAGLRQHWPGGPPARVRALVERELALIAELDYPHYFLTVHEIMQWARDQGILCQGRGSAANSAVCFVLGITVVNPERFSTLFERFISRERNEPPDIDVDFENIRREEVFAHIYEKYGRRHAAIVATVIRYRPKSAIRDVGKALGLSLVDIDTINRSLAWWEDQDSIPERLRAAGFDPESPLLQRLLALVPTLLQFPRHLSQHVGGFVITEQPLDTLVPIENAAMPERTVIQWDKDDIDAVGLFKIDCLALGMLTAIHKTFDMLRETRGLQLSIPGILASEAAQGSEARQVFAMLGQAQSVGVFQVESRAQMSMLPRMRPRHLYDLTIETAIVRPGPIQGGMVHPYLNRRMGKEPIDCPPALEPVLGRTLGIPIFQEQVMEICAVGAGFAPGEADAVRRSMAAWGREDRASLDRFEQRLKSGMQANGHSAEFAARIFEQIKGFAEYGFPESHAASFAVLVYVTAWLKRFEPAAFLAGLLSSQPMGFYSPAQLTQDFRRLHGVRVLPADVLHSTWESQLERQPDGHWAVRLGLQMVKGLSEDCGRRIAAALTPASAAELFRQCRVGRGDRQALAAADALRSLSGSRHQAHWASQGHENENGPLALNAVAEPRVALRPPGEGDDIIADYASLGLTLRRHPLALLRSRLKQQRVITARQWRDLADGRPCRVAGLVTNRQRPGTAQGIIFMTLEDETGCTNLVVRPPVLKRQRLEVLQAPLVVAIGRNENREGVRHLLVERFEDHSALLGRLQFHSRDFH